VTNKPQQEGELYCHYLKCWPKYFAQARSGLKPFEIRKNDRDFTIGDVLVLMEWLPDEKRFTGRDIYRRVISIVHGGQFGIRKGYCVMGLKSMRKPK